MKENQNIDREFFEAIIENLDEGVVIFNAEGYITSYNSVTRVIFDVPEEFPIVGSKTINHLRKAIRADGSSIHPNDFPSAVTLRTGQPCTNEVFGLYTNDWNLKWLRIKSKLMTVEGKKFVFLTFTDITQIFETNKVLEQKNQQLQEVIREASISESKFSSVFNYSGIGKALLSIDGNCIDVNPALCKMLDYSKEELVNITFQDITHPDDQAKDLHFTKLMLNKRIETYKMEKRFYKKDGDILWVSLTVSLVWKDEHTPDFFICQIVNITETKTLLKELSTKNKTLSVTSKALEKRVKQLNDFNNIVAHNLRGPVANSTMLLQLLTKTEIAEERNYFIKVLQTANQEQNKTLDELVKILKIELHENIPSELSSFDEVVNKVKNDLMVSILDKKAEIKTTFKVDSIVYPKVYLESIIYNLVSNSLKYSNDHIPPVITISSETVNDKVELQVSDNGVGIDMTKYGNDLFKPNKTFHSGYDSKGIGLYITKNQVENLGGSIQVQSQVGKGSTFSVCFESSTN